MAKKPKPRIKVPRSASKGEVVTIKTLISHTMESGQRKDKKTGELIPRKIINKFSAKYMGGTVFEADLEPAISANPYISFELKAMESGPIEFEWTEDGGETFSATKKIKVA